MARDKTLGSLLTSLRAELEISVNVAHNVQARDIQVHHLQRVQEQLWDDYTWPHLRVFRYLQPQAGERYYDITGCLKQDDDGALVAASDMSVDRVIDLWVRDGTIWRQLGKGVTEDNYNAFDSDTDERSWPPQRWQVAEGNQLELWPIPDLTGDLDAQENIVRVRGVRNLSPFTADAHTADLDDRLITLMAAAEILGGEKGQKKMTLANRRLLKIRGNATKTQRFRLFGATDNRPVLRGPPTVYYRTT